MSELREHPAAAVFPLLEGKNFDDLVADIKANGLLNAVIIWHGLILDGRNRLAACKAAGIEPRFEEWEGEDPVAFVISANLHRRHLTAVQRAAIAARLADLKQGAREDLRLNNNRETNALETSPPVEKLSVSKAAQLMRVSPTSAAAAKIIYGHGTQEQISAMERGELPLRPTAEKLRHPEPENKHRGPRADRLAPYKPESDRQRARAQGQKDRMVESLSVIRGHCRGLAEFDLGMAAAACSAEEIKTWTEIARDNARVLVRFAIHLEKAPTNASQATEA